MSPCSVFVGCARVSRLMSRALPREQSSFPPRCFGFLFLFHFPGYILCRVRSMGVMRSFSRNTSWLDFSNANTCGNTSLQNSTVQRRVQVFVLDQTAWYNCAPVVFLIRWDLLLGALGRRCVDGNGAVQIVVLDFAQLSLQDTSYGGPARLWWWRQGVSSAVVLTSLVLCDVAHSARSSCLSLGSASCCDSESHELGVCTDMRSGCDTQLFQCLDIVSCCEGIRIREIRCIMRLPHWYSQHCTREW